MKHRMVTCALDETVNQLKPGLAVDVDDRQFYEAYGGRASTVRQAISHFLSGCVGSAYGTIRADFFVDRNVPIVRITCHESDEGADHGGFMYHVDEDREWMFDRVPGGWRRRA